MNQLTLTDKRPKGKYYSYKGEAGKVADNIINRDFSTERPMKKWTTDVSQCNVPLNIYAAMFCAAAIFTSSR